MVSKNKHAPRRAEASSLSVGGQGKRAPAARHTILKRPAVDRGSRSPGRPQQASVRRDTAERDARSAPAVRAAAGRKPGPLLTLRASVILMAALLAAAASGVLTFLTTGSLPEAFLAVGPALAAAITLLNAIVGQ
jgi:hypothetical protein